MFGVCQDKTTMSPPTLQTHSHHTNLELESVVCAGQYLSMQTPPTCATSTKHHPNTVSSAFRSGVSIFLPRRLLCTGSLGLQFLKEVTLSKGENRLLWVWGSCGNTFSSEMLIYRAHNVRMRGLAPDLSASF